MCENFASVFSWRRIILILQISSSKDVWVQNQKKTTKIQSFQIEDETDSIKVVFWGDKTLQCKKLCVGDVITLKNVNIHRYHNDVSLQSTQATNIKQVDSHCSWDPNVELRWAPASCSLSVCRLARSASATWKLRLLESSRPRTRRFTWRWSLGRKFRLW